MQNSRSVGFAVALLLVAAAVPSCSKNAKQGGTSDGEVIWVDPKTLQPGPIRHQELTETQMERIRALQATFAEVDDHSVEKWVDDFKRDLDPDKELRLWEVMANAYISYCEKRELSAEAKQDVFRVVLLRSMATEKEVLEKVTLKTITKADAAEVMRAF